MGTPSEESATQGRTVPLEVADVPLAALAQGFFGLGWMANHRSSLPVGHLFSAPAATALHLGRGIF